MVLWDFFSLSCKQYKTANFTKIEKAKFESKGEN